MNNKKALAKTFWNIWECEWVGAGEYLRSGYWGFVWGERDCDGDAGESVVRKI